MGQLATFKIGEEMFGVDLLLSKEISKIHNITQVPEAPDFVFGLMNLRGQIVTVIKPSVLMEKEDSELTENSRLLILKTRDQTDILIKRGLISSNHLGEDSLALVIDSVGDVIEYDDQLMGPVPPHIKEKHKDLVSGVLQLNNNLIVALDMKKFQECVSNTMLEDQS